MITIISSLKKRQWLIFKSENVNKESFHYIQNYLGLSREWIPCWNLYTILQFTELSRSLSHQTFTRTRHDQFLLCPFNRKGYWHWEKLKLNHRLPIRHIDKEPTCQWRRCKRHRFSLWLGKISWGGKWQPTPIFLPGKSHGQRSLVGYSSCVCKELNTNSDQTTPLPSLEDWRDGKGKGFHLFPFLTSLHSPFNSCYFEAL